MTKTVLLMTCLAALTLTACNQENSATNAASGEKTEGSATPNGQALAAEFTRGGEGCGQFGAIPITNRPDIDEKINTVVQSMIMRRCLLEGVPVTSAEEEKIAPIVAGVIKGQLASLGDRAKTGGLYQGFLESIRKIITDKPRLNRIEAHVASLLRPSEQVEAVPSASDGAQMIAANQPAGGTQILQPEFERGNGGCGQFGTVDLGGAQGEALKAASDTVQYIVFRRCMLEGVKLTDAEDQKLIPAIQALAVGVGRDLNDKAKATSNFDTFLEQARTIVTDADRLKQIEAHVTAAKASPRGGSAG